MGADGFADWYEKERLGNGGGKTATDLGSTYGHHYIEKMGGGQKGVLSLPRGLILSKTAPQKKFWQEKGSRGERKITGSRRGGLR